MLPKALESTWSQQVAISESLYFMSGLKKHSPHEVRTAFLTLLASDTTGF